MKPWVRVDKFQWVKFLGLHLPYDSFDVLYLFRRDRFLLDALHYLPWGSGNPCTRDQDPQTIPSVSRTPSSLRPSPPSRPSLEGDLFLSSSPPPWLERTDHPARDPPLDPVVGWDPLWTGGSYCSKTGWTSTVCHTGSTRTYSPGRTGTSDHLWVRDRVGWCLRGRESGKVPGEGRGLVGGNNGPPTPFSVHPHPGGTEEKTRILSFSTGGGPCFSSTTPGPSRPSYGTRRSRRGGSS